MIRRLVIFGAGQLGVQLGHQVLAHGDAEILGFIDDTRPAGLEVMPGLRTLGGLAGAADKAAGADLVFGIGYGDMRARRLALQRTMDAGWTLHTFVHPSAVVEPSAEVGPGCVVLAGAVIDQRVRVGAGCYVDIGVRLTNGTTVGSNNWFSSGTATGSRVHIGDDCFFGMDCTVTTDVRLGSRLSVNAKTLLARDLGDDLKVVQRHQTLELPQPPQRS